MSDKTRSGRVVLIGAGPGSPGLLTVAAIDVLVFADIVFYDRLAGDAFRRFVRPSTELVDVGKRPGRLQRTQDAISARLVAEARAGKIVARVKGGTPFVFGRGWEEVLTCSQAGVEVHVVPGLTSAIAGPTAAGIPLTYRGLPPLFTVVSGHTDPALRRPPVDWKLMARLGGAIVILMGVGTFAEHARELLAAGMAPDTPVAAIEWATTPEQRVVSGTLADGAETFTAAGLESPAVIVIGRQAALPEALESNVGDLLAPEVRAAETPRGSLIGPLAGWRVAVARSRTTDSTLVQLLRAKGADSVEVPVIRFVDPQDREPFRAAVGSLCERSVGAISWTSAVAVDWFFAALYSSGFDARLLSGSVLVAQNAAVSAALRACALRVDVKGEIPPMASSMRSTALLIGEVGQLGRTNAAVAVASAAGWDAYGVPVVDAKDDQNARDMDLAGTDAVVFASSRTAEAWGRLGLLRPPVVACIGPQTAAAAEAAGLAPDVVPAEPGMQALVDALVEHATVLRRTDLKPFTGGVGGARIEVDE